MDRQVNTVATFVTERFNTTVTKPTFINPGCFGDDLALWLGEELRRDGFSVGGNPVPEDFGWAVSFDVKKRRYWAVIGYVPRNAWYIAVERRGPMAMFSPRFRAIPDDAVDAVKRVLVRGADIRDLQWHSARDFFKGLAIAGSP
jgi:hypothetical protein